MQLPTVHLNGTSKESLIESLANASNALENAYQALRETAPNGRDYYPQGPQALEQAQREHIARLKLVDAVKREIGDLAVAIDEME